MKDPDSRTEERTNREAENIKNRSQKGKKINTQTFQKIKVIADHTVWTWLGRGHLMRESKHQLISV